MNQKTNFELVQEFHDTFNCYKTANKMDLKKLIELRR